MARIHGCRYGRTQVHVTQTQHQIGRSEDYALYCIDIVKAVDATDKLQITRTPGRILAHRLRIFLNRQLRLAIVPSQRQMHDTRRHHDIFNGGQ